jgi:hypothetical protein
MCVVVLRHRSRIHASVGLVVLVPSRIVSHLILYFDIAYGVFHARFYNESMAICAINSA